MRSYKSAGGLTSDVLKSGLQKYIRRGLAESAVRCARDLHSTEAPRALRTNLGNRIAIAAMEDIGIADPGLIVLAQQVTAQYVLETAASPTQRTDPTRLLALVQAAADAQKSRLVSHARAAHSGFPPVDAQTFAARLKQRDETAVRIVLAANTPARSLWSQLLAEAPEKAKAAMAALAAMHKRMARVREAPCFLIAGILLITRAASIPDAAFAAKRLPALRPVPEAPLREVDDYCIDKHTARGKRLGRDSKVFAEEGSKVANSAPWGLDQAYYAAYMQQRTGAALADAKLGAAALADAKLGAAADAKAAAPLSEIPLESTIARDPLRIQLVTSDSKTCTYFANLCVPVGALPVGALVVIKGPLTSEQAERQLYVDQLKCLPGMTRVGFETVRAVVDRFPNIPLGRRRRCYGQPSHFLVSPSALHAADVKASALATTTRSSAKWPVTTIYDMAHDLRKRGDVANFALVTNATVHLLVALAFRYVFNIGDVCARNFICVGSKAFSLDEDDCGGSYIPRTRK